MISRYQLIGNLICGIVLSGIYLIHFVNLQYGSEKNTAQSRAVIILSHTQRFANQQYSTILTISCSTLVKSYKPNSNFLHSYQRTNSFWCNRKTTILTELLPPSYLFDTHPASFLLVHQLFNCWKLLQTPHLRHFWTLHHHSAYLSLLLATTNN